MEKALYYECHVTIEPVFDERLEQLKAISKTFYFKVADLLMHKAGSILTPSVQDSFCTARHTDDKFLLQNMLLFLEALKSNNFKIYRYKLENCFLDSKINDIFEKIK